MLIRSSKHIISHANKTKTDSLNELFVNYQCDLETYICYIVDGVLPLKNMMSSSLIPAENIKHSRYKQLIYKHASEIIRSQIDKSNKKRYASYRKVYAYFKHNNRQTAFLGKKFSELNLKDIKLSRFFTTPKIKKLSINLDERFFNIEKGKHFDFFVNIKLPIFNEKGTRALQINIPINKHKHSNNFAKDGFKLKKNIQLKKVGDHYFMNLIWEKEVNLKPKGRILGVDIGYNKLIVSSDKQFIGDNLRSLYEKITKKKKYSKAYYRLLAQRDSLINESCNQLQVDDISKIVIEDIKNVKKDKSFKRLAEKGKNKLNKAQQTDYNNKSQYWSYRKVIDKLTSMCEVNGIELVKVSPAYTSQTCSECSHVDENSRDKEEFSCTSCGEKIDADYNASINIRNRGEGKKLADMVPLDKKFIVFHNNE